MADTEGTTAISRRGFLKMVGTGSALVVFDARGIFEGSPLAALTDDNGVLVTELFRPDDQLHLIFEFVNLRHDVATNTLVSTGTGTPLMRIGLPRQHVSEQPVIAGEIPPNAFSAPIPHRVAGQSRLVFAVTTPLGLDVASLLDLERHTLLTTNAAGDPDDDTTMIEVPADLRWSPDGSIVIDTDVAPITFGSVSQLHRFIMRGSGPGGVEFTPVFNASSVDGFDRRVPDASQRSAIVAAATTEGPAVSDRIWLTPAGAWADIAREWTNTDWIQHVQGGRDQFVKVVERGVLLPFGVPAMATSTVTRQWIADTLGSVVAATITEEHFAIVGSPVVEFPGTGAPNEGRDLPFRSIRVEGRESVRVEREQLRWTILSDDEPPRILQRSIAIDQAWKVVVGPGVMFSGQDIRPTYTGTDRAGNQSASFFLSAVFVPSANVTTPLLDKLAEFYASDEGTNSRVALVSSSMAWAEPLFENSRDTTFLTSEIEFSFRMGVEGAQVAPHATLGRLLMTELIPPNTPAFETSIEVVFTPEFLTSGNDPVRNPSAAFLDLVVPVDVPIGAEARSVMTPDFTAEEFNQTLGLGSKLEKSAPTATEPGVPVLWRPEDSFGDAAKLLGGINLADLVLPILIDIALPGIDIPEFSVLTLPESITQTHQWCPNKIKSVPNLGFVATADTSLCVLLETVISLDRSIRASATIVFEVRNFTLVVPPIFSLIEFDVNSLKAFVPSDGPADLTFDVEDWRLGGALAWIEPLLASLVPPGSAFDVNVASTSIDIDLSIALPDFNLGVLVIRNFALGLFGTFPFVDEDPRIEFSVGSSTDPVGIQIMQFGGAFFCEVALSATDIVKVHILAQVSARLFAIDVGFAEGYLEVGVSAEFIWNGGGVVFKGTLVAEAVLDILGVVSASVRVEVRVVYDGIAEIISFSGTLYWSVTLIWTVKGSVPIVKTEFAVGDGNRASGSASRSAPQSALLSQASSGSPAGSFGDLHSLATWNDYVSKFAPEV